MLKQTVSRRLRSPTDHNDDSQPESLSGIRPLQHASMVRLSIGERRRPLRIGPDGFLYVLTDEVDGAILKIDPAQ